MKHVSQPKPKTNPGQYDYAAHGGKGKSQKLLPPAVGAGYNKKTPNAEPIPHRGQGAEGSGYNTDAHTKVHHGKSGKAMGKSGDIKPMDYDAKIFGEGRAHMSPAPGSFVTKMSSEPNKAEHHPRAGAAHTFNRPPSTTPHGFGHPAHLRSGPLRMSGHSGAHRIGKK